MKTPAEAVAATLAARQVAESVEELLAGAQQREPFNPVETRSSVAFEKVRIENEQFIVKYVHLDDDFTMRASGDLACRPLRAWEAGLFDVAPQAIDHAVVGAAGGVGRNGLGCAFLMRDVSPYLVAPGDDPFPEDQHARFLDHLAAMCASTWGWHDDLGMMPYGARWGLFGMAAIEGERQLGWPEAVPRIAADGWERFLALAPRAVGAGVDELLHDVTPLTDALRSTPSCFLHGDWKASNLGTGPDGRTVLIDWVYLGEGPACHELCWYLALNRSRLPPGHTKEGAIEDFRAALERHGVTTSEWWDRQIHLALLGTLVEFGWEKALGDEAELAWWCEAAAQGLELL
ncbi:MAG TPA: hypothetical protein VM142_13300 [Acidimicrobiales bacterium]|nr:hypothetical protein [Acidimicrobiales bacterium]